MHIEDILTDSLNAETVETVSLVIYALDDYEDDPVLAYYTEYTDADEEPFVAVLDATTGDVLCRYSQLKDVDTLAYGYCELDKILPLILIVDAVVKNKHHDVQFGRIKAGISLFIRS